ncbi:MAG: ferredoxin [Candidatus Binatia bacterium]
MRVIVDPNLCEGNGFCESLTPEIFRVGDDDRADVLASAPDESLRGKIEAAVRRCPRQAIRVEE